MRTITAGAKENRTETPRILVVGAGTRFLSGISYYTLRLINELATTHQVSGILMRQLLPTRLYPGHDRVGKTLTQVQAEAPVFDGVDWYWLPSIIGALAFLFRQQPQTVIFEWWTGTVLHTYLLLALAAKLLGAKVIIEFHEVLDTGEARIPAVLRYVNAFMPLLIRLADAFVVHSQYDYRLLEEHYRLRGRPVVELSHASYDQYALAKDQSIARQAPADCYNVLFFGVIRPFKGLEDLIRAFELIPADQIAKYWLTIVGEPWEGWSLPLDLIKASPYRDRITLVDRYVDDREVAAYFAGADIVALPYHRSSSSGPLHVAMSWGLPVVVSEVGGLVEASARYEGVVLVPPANPEALLAGIAKATGLVGQHYADPHSWNVTTQIYSDLVSKLASPRWVAVP